MKMRKIMKINKFYIGIFITLLVISLAFTGGYKYYNCTHPVTTVTDTTFVYDTIVKEIPVNHYSHIVDTVFFPDTLIIPADVDTAEILRKFYSRYVYARNWEDSLIKVSFKDTVSQNKIQNSSNLKYQILRPQTVIVNETNIKSYSSYLNISMSSDLKIQYPEFKLQLIGKNISYGVGYAPKQNTVRINFGYNFLKMK